MMGDLQAAIEFQVELGKFYNVDLFQRGYYQIRVSLKSSPKIQSKVEVNLPRNSECSLVFPASIVHGAAVSKTFQILYRNEDVLVNDIILFKINMLVDSQRIEESIEKADFQLGIDLWFTEEDFGPDQHDKMACISQRNLKLHLKATEGIHHHIPVLYDYFHLCAICVTIHGVLVALHQPYTSFLRQPKTAWADVSNQPTLETVLLGGSPVSVTGSVPPSESRLQFARKMHSCICNILLSAYESLQNSLENLTKRLPHSQQLNLAHKDCSAKLDSLVERAKHYDLEEDLVQWATSDITQLCAENMILWTQYLEIVTSSDGIIQQLARDHHIQRVKRLAEGFFMFEYQKHAVLDCYDNSTHGHNEITSLVRSSQYFQLLPVLQVECTELDGDATTLPIVFEDIYAEPLVAKKFTTAPELGSCVNLVERSASLRSSTGSVGSDPSSPRSRRRRKFIKNIRPEAFKRPSYSMQGEGQIGKLMDQKDCSLVGYRKINNDSLPMIGTGNQSVLTQIELGTLSPAGQGRTVSAFGAAVSMPTLKMGAEARISLSASLPDLHLEKDVMVAQELSQLPASKNAESESSDISVSAESENKNDCVFVDNIEASLVKTSENENTNGTTSTRNIVNPSNCQRDSSTSDDGNNVQNGYFSSGNEQEGSDSSPGTHNGQNVNVIDYNNLAETITQALGEPEKSNPAEDNHQTVELKESKKGSDSVVLCKKESTRATDSNVQESTAKPTANGKAGVEKVEKTTYMSQECTVLELLKEEYERSITEKESDEKKSEGQELTKSSHKKFLVSPVSDATINFITVKEKMKQQLNYSGHLYSDFPSQASTVPYFWSPSVAQSSEDDEGIHLFICVHGLDGNSADLRLVRTYLEIALPGEKIDFLMSERNQSDTFADFDTMTNRLVKEILYHLDLYSYSPSRISFIGHSLGNLIIRSVLAHEDFAVLLPKLYTFLSLSGPHLGTLYNNSGLVNMGMWFMQKWKKSGSLLQLSMKDTIDPRQSFLYKLSQKPGLEFFKHILLVGSSQDRYVPYHSSRIELCRPAVRDTSSSGAAYCEMASNILQPIVFKSDITLIRYDVFHALTNTANNLIGRAAHIAVLDSEIFIEKFLTVAGLKYLK